MSKIKHYETMFILKPTLTEEEKNIRILNFSASLKVLQNAMREDMQGYTSSI